MVKMQQQVEDFHRKFSLATGVNPGVPDDNVLALRRELIKEEANEFIKAAFDRDLPAMVDGIADLLYVVFGAAVSLGVDIEQYFDEVHRSNMSKVWEDGTIHRRDDGKILKPPTYSPADIIGLLNKEIRREGLGMWVVYDRPTDFPDSVIVRYHKDNIPTTDYLIFPSLLEVHKRFNGHTFIPRFADDNVSIMGVYI